MKRFGWLIGSVGLVTLTFWAYVGPAVGEGAEAGIRVGPADAFNPVTAGEALPEGFRQLLPRDAIAPIYDPAFVSADEVPWPAETQVIGVSTDDEAKAYPVSFLTRREMVLDEIGGDPILVSW
jgi:hypothetical protein